jgi:DUF2075 family protein
LIVYQATKARFLNDAFDRDIEQVISDAYYERTQKKVGAAEITSWKESLLCMARVLRDEAIPPDAGVAIEYNIPQTAKRVDFIVTGRGEDQSSNVIIVELKQWAKASLTGKDAVVRTRFKAGESEVSHPSYQAWSYAALLQGFNEAIEEEGMALQPCAYLHNYAPDEVIAHESFQHYIAKAPLFLKGELERARLQAFIKRYVKYGDNQDLIYQLENGRIRPSKSLVDSLAKMLKGNQEFILVDDQKVVYESALAIARSASDTRKQVVIVQGGPGSGKSVVAINLLVALSSLGLVSRYVSKNAAPRAVYESKLTGVLRKTEISNLFSGSGAFTEAEPNCFDVLVVDEAHRLNEKSGLYSNLGENQIKEIIGAAKCTIFFVDDDQVVTLKDIGHSGELEQWAGACDAAITRLELTSQFRCNGSDGYLAWLDNTLSLRETANQLLDTAEFEFRVLDSPTELHALIEKKNEEANKARVVAGYCWLWPSKSQAKEYDIEIPEHGYRRRWNLASDGSLWIVAKSSVEEVGCIHTSQGLEVDYIGVIVGPDLIVRKGDVITRPECRASSDKSISGYKKLLKAEPVSGKDRIDRIIKNTYRTLMTRGMKGCYVYCTDHETAEYFRSHLMPSAHAPAASRFPQLVAKHEMAHSPTETEDLGQNVLPFQRVAKAALAKESNAVPLIDLKFAAGTFAEGGFQAGDVDWLELPKSIPAKPGYFVAQVVGESMNRRIPNGAWCLFRGAPTGTRVGKVVVAAHRSIHDPDLGGSYTVKLYASEKIADPEGSWRHTKIELRPDSTDARFQPIVITSSEEEEFRVVAELLRVLS